MKKVLHGVMRSEFFLPPRGKGDRLWRWMRGFPAKPYLFSRAPKKIIAAFLCAALLLTAAGCSRGSPGEVSTVQTAEQTTEKPQFPMALDNGKVTVEELFGADGLFTEKGNLDEVKNVTALRVKNNSTEMLEYGMLSFKVNGIERAEFAVSALPAGESVVVMESFARPWSEEDSFELEKDKTAFAYITAQTENEDVRLEVKGSEFTVTNLSAENRDITIVYKYFKNNTYYGGIAFRGKFENISPGETVKKTSDRFDENCKIVNVISESINTESEVIQ